MAMQVPGALGSNTVWVDGTINGSAGNPISNQMDNFGNVSYAQGLLLDPNTALIGNVAAALMNTILIAYDIVPL